MFYSKSTGGFYDKAIHGDKIPLDAVEITDKEYAALFDGQSSGKSISADPSGAPVLTDPPAPTDEQLAAAIRAERDARMASFQWRIDRYASEVRLGMTTTDDIAVLDAYMQSLRDITKQASFPLSVTWRDIPA